MMNFSQLFVYVKKQDNIYSKNKWKTWKKNQNSEHTNYGNHWHGLQTCIRLLLLLQVLKINENLKEFFRHRYASIPYLLLLLDCSITSFGWDV